MRTSVRPENLVIHPNPCQDTPTSSILCNRYAIRFLYSRSADCQMDNTTGQDDVRIAYSDNVICFALCDGVSQSFFGDLAAQALSDGLINWLGKIHDIHSRTRLVRSLRTNLSILTKESQSMINNTKLPDDMPPIVRDVLEEKRTLGSQSMFVCGRIDLPEETSDSGRIVLAWFGDCRLSIWSGLNKKVMSATNISAERWSTKDGFLGGDPHIYIETELISLRPHHPLRILAYSDGFQSLDQIETAISTRNLNKAVSYLLTTPQSDDISFVEIILFPDKQTLRDLDDTMALDCYK